MTDPAILAEARAFNAQEMIHSRAHMKHVKALVAKYPGLQEVLDGSVARYEGGEYMTVELGLAPPSVAQLPLAA